MSVMVMNAMTIAELMQAYSKVTGKPCMYISFGDEIYTDAREWFDEICKAAPYLNIGHYGQILADGQAILEFDSEEEMNRHYDMTVGDDGPTKLNPYDGLARVYALTCINGELRRENT